ncbi:adenylate/guanylate cyclase domain-containing protein [Plantactinospora sp. KLBMP9567]|uniref:adenylate/guanylate cyclase domain-containing protein n=1 Tax=Plantactinospora sp. KLBMP9567 TaxID=3085900 RepID=UPI002980D11A|nr:adenylate/guanylate cyclase domain-containing protein [Plantactinospora sp. KLBMP9567]MDW5329054.1 adenylate/guanylate cyclase domain-containing protein [Plantactinospora sp. KLBMP9567]
MTLSLGESGFCEAVALFIDLEQFTQRTFWDPPHEMVLLAHAVLAEVSRTVVQNGGHVLGLRGDGLFACFGCAESNPAIDATIALASGAQIMDAAKSVLNPMLRERGIEPVQVRAGADFGRLDFVRIGADDISEINVVGFAANFAAKCEKYANSWEYVVGEKFRELLMQENVGLFSEHVESPKRYTRNYETKQYRFYDVSWRRLLSELDGVSEHIAGNPTSAIKIF